MILHRKVLFDIRYSCLDMYVGSLNCWVSSIFKCLQEKRLEEEGAAAQVATKLAQEASHANMARDLSNEVCQKDSEIFKVEGSFIRF